MNQSRKQRNQNSASNETQDQINPQAEQKEPQSKLEAAAPSVEKLFPLIVGIVNFEDAISSKMRLDDFMRQVELGMVVKCLEKTEGNQAKAAQILGLNRTTLIMRIRALRGLGLDPMAYKFKDNP